MYNLSEVNFCIELVLTHKISIGALILHRRKSDKDGFMNEKYPLSLHLIFCYHKYEWSGSRKCKKTKKRQIFFVSNTLYLLLYDGM
jgi:hypothetical protein